jgi:hypothetical protein
VKEGRKGGGGRGKAKRLSTLFAPLWAEGRKEKKEENGRNGRNGQKEEWIRRNGQKGRSGRKGRKEGRGGGKKRMNGRKERKEGAESPFFYFTWASESAAMVDSATSTSKPSTTIKVK